MRKQLPNYLFILPHYFFFAVFLLYPIFRGVQISLFDWKIMLQQQRFIGLANYQSLMQDKIFWEVLGNTVQFMVITVVINVILALVRGGRPQAPLLRQRLSPRALLCARDTVRLRVGHHRHPRLGFADRDQSTIL